MFIMLSSAAFAEDAPQLPTIQLEADKALVAYKSGNMDIPRSEDDAQPYTVIDRTKIENAGVTTVSELLTKVLSMSAPSGSGYFTGSSSQINLRGLGTNQTLILINGRRSAGVGSRGSSEATNQPNLDNIPMAAIERIEILPTSAAAIYGSGAVGGVINVILRRDYVGSEIDVRYGNTVKDQQAVKSANIVTGFALEGGRTNVMLSASKRDQDALSNSNTKWQAMGRDLISKNNSSALGNPPAGSLVNIKSVDGSALTPGLGATAHIPKGWDGNLANLQQGYNTDISDQMSAVSSSIPLIDKTNNESFGLSINRDFSDRLNLFLEANYAKEEGKALTSPHGYGTATIYGHIREKNADGKWVNTNQLNPNNPFGKDVLVNYPVRWQDINNQLSTFKTTNKRVATGFTFDVTPEWLISGDYSWSETDIRIQYPRRGSKNPNAVAWENDLNAGLIDLIKDSTSNSTDVINRYWNYPITHTKQTLHDFSLRGTGPVATWYAGKINLATGVEHRRSEGNGFGDYSHVDNPNVLGTETKSNTTSLYGELNIPFISPEMGWRFAHLFDVQLATRYERFDVQSSIPQYAGTINPETGYNDIYKGMQNTGKSTFDATTPTIGFRFAPNEQIMLRASYSEGFITPTTSQLAIPSQGAATSTTLTDPKTGKNITEYTAITGGDPNITPEKSKSYNAGIIVTPDVIPNLRVSVDYFKIKKTNNIASIDAQYVLDHQDQFPGRVSIDKDGKYTINTTNFNALGLTTSGVDTNINYWFDSFLGQTTLNLGYTYTDEYRQQQNLKTPEKDFVGTVGAGVSSAPLKHRANASVFLQATDVWGFGWSSQFYDAYKLMNANAILNQTGEKNTELKIGRQIYHDVFARAKFKIPQVKAMDSAEITFGIHNLFNDYTLDMSNSDYLSEYSDPLGRQYYLNFKFRF
ncbi:TonB-dependent receptor [Acinetobacter larvae]|uniref:TonB-dependent receptor n=1 Tax=Acinetobacter larvae TaxID=1789224 RepID=A0A1B2M3X7_9GAMM|nr:TonB-dependent receptor [Acinetobacter larvae]